MTKYKEGYKILYIPDSVFLSHIRFSDKKIAENRIKKIVSGLNIKNVREAQNATCFLFLWHDLKIFMNNYDTRTLPYYETEFEVVEMTKNELENEEMKFKWD